MISVRQRHSVVRETEVTQWMKMLLLVQFLREQTQTGPLGVAYLFIVLLHRASHWP